MTHGVWLATFTHRAHNDEVRRALLSQSRDRRADTTGEGVRKRRIYEEPPTLHHYLLIAQEVSHRDSKGTAHNISLHVGGARCSQHEYSFLSCGEGELANKRSFIDIWDVSDTPTLRNGGGERA
jgi:hypothetical protein